MKRNRQEFSAATSACTETITIDLTDKSNLSTVLSIPLMGYRNISIDVNQVGCTGIAGEYVIKQSVNSSGSNTHNLQEGALTITSSATGNAAIIQGTLSMEYLVIELPATLPAIGSITVTVTAKR